MRTLIRPTLGVALTAAMSLSVLASSVSPSFATTHVKPTISPTQAAFSIPASPAGTWILRLWTFPSPAKLLGMAQGTSGNLSVPVPHTSTCHFQADVRFIPTGGTTSTWYSGDIAALSQCGAPCPTPPQFPGLDGASAYAVFAFNGDTTQSGNFSLVTVNGDVGVASGATVTNQAPSVVNGNVHVDSGGSFSGPGKVHGTVFTGQDLSSQRAAALGASSQAAALSPDFTFGNVNSSTTVTGKSGLNVVDITGSVNLNNGSLTLSGPSDAFFVVNVAGSISLVGTGGIVVGGSVPESNLLVNMTGSAAAINTHIGNVLEGTLLGPNAGGSLDGAFGSLLLGGNFTLMSGATVTFEGCP